jgi:TetR/AcrR family transcriptional regulator, transcriptional repressor for nem operon
MARTKDFDEDEVLAKAMHLFWLKGYNATSMQDLVDGLGISRSSMYDTFGDKHSLFVRALENYKKNGRAGLLQIKETAKSAKEALNAIIYNILLGIVNDSENKGCFMVNASIELGTCDETVSSILCENDLQTEEMFYDIIKKGQQTGEIRTDKDARLLTRFILNNVKGLQVSTKSVTEPQVFNEIMQLALSVLD